MSQSKLGSLAEAVVNTAIGLLVAMFATAGICKLYGIPMTWENNFIITFWMTVLSVLRSYLLRRLFNFNWLRFKTNWRIWWILNRPRIMRFIDRMAEYYGQGRRPRL